VTIDSITFGGTDAGNYEIANNLSTLTADITPASISTITGITAENKVYDRTTNATLDTSGVSFTGLIGSDVLNVATSTGNFDNWNVGTGKTVNITGLTLGGTDANNYTLAEATASTTADITKKQVTLDLQGAATKVYDGTTSLSLNGVTALLNNVISGDEVTVATGDVTGFVNKNVGTNKEVTYTGFGLGGAQVGNYDVGAGSASSTASITRLDSVTWVGGASGNWFDPSNWAGGAVPDLSNVANVIIPTGVTVSFDTTGAAGLADVSSSVNIDNLGSLGSMSMENGAINVVNNVTLSSFTQNGGTLEIGENANIANLVQTAGAFDATNLDVTNSFSQIGTGTLTVSGDATFDVGTNDFTLSNSGNSFGSLGIIANDVAISNFTGALTLANMNVAGTLGVNIAGDILQKAGTTVAVTGETTLATTSGNIALDGVNNDFSTVNVTGANVTLADINAIELGNISSTGTLGVDAIGDITQTSGTALTISGNTNLATSSGDITINSATNNFSGSLSASGNTITIDNYTHALTLGDVVSQTALNITTDNQMITQAIGATLVSNGTATLNAGTSDVTLSNNGNDFNELTLTGNNLTFKDSVGGVTLGDITTAGTFSATSSGGNIAQKSGTSLALTGNANFDSGNYNTVLTNTGNDFTTLSLAGKDVSFKDSVGTTTLGNVATTGTFSATNTVGGITQGTGTSMSIGTDASFNVGTNNFALSNSGNNFGSLGVTATNVDISNISGNLTLGNMNVAGTFGVNIDSSILQKTGTTIDVTGATTLASTSGNVKLDNATNDFSTINVSGKDVALADKNGIELGNISSTGTLGLTVKDNITQTSNSIITATGATTLASTSGDVKLDNATNDFSTINVSGKDVALADKNGIELGNISSTGTLGLTANGEISQVPGSKLKVSGITSLDAGNSNINLTSKENQLLGLINVKGGVVVLETANVPKFGDVQTDKPIKGGKIQTSKIERIIDQSLKQENLNNLNETISKNINNILQNKIVNNPLDTKTNLEQKINVDYFTDKTIIQTLQLDQNSKLLTVSQPLDDENTYRVTLNELKDMNESDIEQNNVLVSLSKNSNVALVNGGISLPEGLEQEFYIIKAENEKKDN
jgi:hypothetical protein